MPVFDKDIASCVCIGKIVKTHGLNGMVAIKLDDSDLLDLNSLDYVFVEINNRLIPYFIESLNDRSTKITVKFYDVDSVEQAENVSRYRIYIEKDWLKELEPDDFYYHEIEGFNVVDQNEGLVGTVVSVVENPAHDLLEVKTETGIVLVPIVDHIVCETDRDARVININAPEGLFDL